MAKDKKPGAAIVIAYHTLCELFGKPANDAGVAAVVADAGKVKLDSDFIVAKEAGFSFALSRPAGGRRSAKKVLSTLFLYSEGTDGYRAFADLPGGFAFTTREALLAARPPPEQTWQLGKGKVPVDTPEASWDCWTVDGLEVRANYRAGAVRQITVCPTEAARGGRECSTHPLHFETRPADAPPDAELVGMALLVAWASERFGLPAKHAATALGQQLAAHTITPRTFLKAACQQTLTTLDVDAKLGDFLWGYTHGLHRNHDVDPRAQAAPRIKQLLCLERDDRVDDRITYTDDFLGTFRHAVENPFYVPDSWDAVARIAPVLDARWADFQATGFAKAPDLSLYEKAAQRRDSVAVVPARAALAPVTVDDSLADELIALIGRPLSDKSAQAVLKRAGLPIGKRIDQQANPALGVAYLGTKFDVGGKSQLGIDAVWFYARGYQSYIRGLGARVEFLGFPGRLPHGLQFGASRAAVIATVGPPQRDFWTTPSYSIACEFKDDEVIMVRFGRL